MTRPPEAGRPGTRERSEADPEAEARERYMASCSEYIKRQVIVYQNWPQRRWDTSGYREEKVFADLNN